MVTELSVAIIDDEPAVRMILAEVIGLTPGLVLVGQAVDGPSGLAVCLESLPDVVVADLRMPGGGHPFIRAMRQQCQFCRIIIHSAHVTQGTTDPLLEAGADAVVPKSASVRGLVEEIKKGSPLGRASARPQVDSNLSTLERSEDGHVGS